MSNVRIPKAYFNREAESYISFGIYSLNPIRTNYCDEKIESTSPHYCFQHDFAPFFTQLAGKLGRYEIGGRN